LTIDSKSSFGQQPGSSPRVGQSTSCPSGSTGTSATREGKGDEFKTASGKANHAAPEPARRPVQIYNGKRGQIFRANVTFLTEPASEAAEETLGDTLPPS